MTMWRMKYAKTLITFVVLLPLLFYFLVTRLDISPEKIGVRQDVSVEYREAGYQSNRVHDHQMVVENPVLQEPSHNVEYKEQDKDVVYHEEQDKAAANHEEPTIESQVWVVPSKTEFVIPETSQSETQFTVVMLTHNRTQVMLKTAESFLKMERVQKVVVLWNNIGLEPPTKEVQVIQEKYNKTIVVKIFTENKIRLRFHVYPEIETSAFFSVDDDLLITEPDMNHAFDIWKAHSYGVVGFTQRGHTGSSSKGYKYDYLPKQHSLILTNAAFVHKEYIRMFEERTPVSVHNLIDKLQNCEDIALNFLVANVCDCESAVWVKPKGKWTHYGQGKGIWRTGNHKQERDHCVDSFAKFFPKLPKRSARPF